MRVRTRVSVLTGGLLTGMLMLAFVFQNLAIRKPDLDSGVFIYAKAGFGDYVGFNSAFGFWAKNAGEYLADEKIRTFQRDGSARAGIFHHLITLPTYHTAALSTDNLAREYFEDLGFTVRPIVFEDLYVRKLAEAKLDASSRSGSIPTLIFTRAPSSDFASFSKLGFPSPGSRSSGIATPAASSLYRTYGAAFAVKMSASRTEPWPPSASNVTSIPGLPEFGVNVAGLRMRAV